MDLPAPRIAMSTITLREITSTTVHRVCRLQVHPHQSHLVAANAVSLAEALFAPQAWFRAVYRDDTIVGFVMLWDDTLADACPPRPEVCLWRLMIDAAHQQQGIGRQVMAQVIRHVLGRPGITRFYSSYVPGEPSAGPFYASLGFVPTGAVDEDGEVIIEYPWPVATD
jgi:diamine N-acetyltransferase